MAQEPQAVPESRPAGLPSPVALRQRGVRKYGTGKLTRGVPLLPADRLKVVAEGMAARVPGPPTAMEMDVRATEAAMRAKEQTQPPEAVPQIVVQRTYANTLYTPEMCAALADDLVQWSLVRLRQGEKAFVLHWAIEKGIHKRRLWDLRDKDPLFAEALEFANTVQQVVLITGALDRKYQGDISKLILMHEHGMAERHDISATASSGMPASVEEADRRIEELRGHRAVLAGILDQAKQLGTGIVDG